MSTISGTNIYCSKTKCISPVLFVFFINAGIVLYYKLKYDFNFKQGIEIIEETCTSETRNEPPRQLVADLKQKGIKLSVEDITTSSLPTAKTITSSPDDDWDGQISIPSKMAMIEPLANQYVVNDEDWDETMIS
ncbi:uncharacterized protein LOC123914466 [Trifolium pratense]|uniref:uncharacterized protein LOC123914466 n=1 Tax=Trifolium pratense TaxID=57577 RepID=UPI001E693D13|nr:uncharacterized protein LOC123914466 [Trifolium pratense]